MKRERERMESDGGRAIEGEREKERKKKKEGERGGERGGEEVLLERLH